MIEFYSSHMLARHVSHLTGPSSGVFFTSCMCRFGMCFIKPNCRNAFIQLHLDVFIYIIPNLHIQLVKNAPEDGPVRSETCQANICDE